MRDPGFLSRILIFSVLDPESKNNKKRRAKNICRLASFCSLNRLSKLGWGSGIRKKTYPGSGSKGQKSTTDPQHCKKFIETIPLKITWLRRRERARALGWRRRSWGWAPAASGSPCSAQSCPEGGAAPARWNAPPRSSWTEIKYPALRIRIRDPVGMGKNSGSGPGMNNQN